MRRVQDKVAIITGAASGLGFAAAYKLLEEGAKVVLTDVNSEVLDSMPERLSSFSTTQFTTFSHDVTQEESWVELINKTERDQGKINILVNSAGISLGADIVSTDFDIWKKVHQVNLDSVFLGCKYAVPIMGKCGYGSIINMSSVVGIKGNVGQANYSASKAAINGFTKSTALELGSRNIRCNVIAPGFIETEMTEVLDEKVVQEWRDSIPLKRGGKPSDIADTCVWLASDMSSYVTGQTIHVNGGLLT